MLVPKKIILNFVKEAIKTNPTVWQEKTYKNETIVFNERETIEKLYFVKDGIFQIYQIDAETNTEQTVGFLFPGDFYVPLSALNDWCPAMAGMRAIGKNNVMLEILSLDWFNLDEDKPLLRKYAISIGITELDDCIKHFSTKKKQTFDEFYKQLKQSNHPLVSNYINSDYLASFFHLHKKTIEKAKQHYRKEQIEIKKLQKNNTLTK